MPIKNRIYDIFSFLLLYFTFLFGSYYFIGYYLLPVLFLFFLLYIKITGPPKYFYNRNNLLMKKTFYKLTKRRIFFSPFYITFNPLFIAFEMYIYPFFHFHKVCHKRYVLKHVDLEIFEPDSKNKTDIFLVFVHGFTSSSRSAFIKNVREILPEYNAAIFTYRGYERELKTDKFPTIGFTEDLEDILKFLRQDKKRKFILIGLSLGANFVAKYLGELGRRREKRKEILGGIGISIPFDFKILSSFNTFYKPFIETAFLKFQKKFFNKNKKVFTEKFIENVNRSISLRELDNHICVLQKYKSLDDYYYHNSTMKYLPHIDRPFLVLNAEDDVLLNEPFPEEIFKSNENLIGVLTVRGGHLGFQGINFNLSVAPLISEFIKAILPYVI